MFLRPFLTWLYHFCDLSRVACVRALRLKFAALVSLVRTEALAYRAISHVRRLARPLFADDKRVYFKNKAWEIQQDMSGRLHDTCKKLRALGSRSSRRPLKTVKLENGELTTTEAQRQQRWQDTSVKLLQASCIRTLPLSSLLRKFATPVWMPAATWTFLLPVFLQR